MQFADHIVAQIDSTHMEKISIISNTDFFAVKVKVAQIIHLEKGFEPDSSYLDRGIFALKQYYFLPIFYLVKRGGFSISISGIKDLVIGILCLSSVNLFPLSTKPNFS